MECYLDTELHGLDGLHALHDFVKVKQALQINLVHLTHCLKLVVM
jgi:hypothetical protein